MMLQFSCILELVAAWAFQVGIVRIPHLRILERLITRWALNWNVVVPLAMLLQLRSNLEVAEVALEHLTMCLHVLL